MDLVRVLIPPACVPWSGAWTQLGTWSPAPCQVKHSAAISMFMIRRHKLLITTNTINCCIVAAAVMPHLLPAGRFQVLEQRWWPLSLSGTFQHLLYINWGKSVYCTLTRLWCMLAGGALCEIWGEKVKRCKLEIAFCCICTCLMTARWCWTLIFYKNLWMDKACLAAVDSRGQQWDMPEVVRINGEVNENFCSFLVCIFLCACLKS